MTLDLERIRAEFPALRRAEIFLDNPAGTQITRHSLERIQAYLVEDNANHGGAFATSQRTDALVETTRQAMAEFIHARRREEIAFGPNMTTLTFRLSRALVRTFQPGDTIAVTRLDHDANISPWMLAAQDQGCRLRWIDFDVEDGTLDMNDFARALEEKPRLVAVGYASNALGTVNPVEEITRMAHAAGALVFIDAVHYLPHGAVDVQALDCDFLACSAYKFFGPHLGILYGKHDLLEAVPAYRLRPAPAEAPGKFETGTNTFENIAGLLGALEYYRWIGETFGKDIAVAPEYRGMRRLYKQALLATQAYEHNLSLALLEAIQAVPGARIYGISDPSRFAERVPTFSITLANQSPRQAAEALARQGINVWDGNFYALAVTERLGLEGKGGLLRIGAAHYNTLEEIQRFGAALRQIAG